MTTLTHAPACPGADMHEFIGAKGDHLLRCRGCRWYVVLDDAEAPATPSTPSTPRVAPVRLVCRDHHDQPVTARGKGCPKCPRPRRTRKKKRAAAPAADHEGRATT